MKINVLFDKEALNNSLCCGWGVSFLADDKVLFDTGEKGSYLLENIRSLGVDIKKIEAVIISHDHWDHWGGLWDLLKINNKMPVFICPNFTREFKDRAKGLGANLIETEKQVQITPGIFSTGEIAGAYHGKYMPEQALVLKTKNGVNIITGCAHPGIIKIIDKVKNKFPDEQIYAVLGGFHLKEADRRAVEIIAGNFKKIGVKKSGPTHCSGETAQEIFKACYGADFISVSAGQTIEI